MFYDAVKNDHGFQVDPLKAIVGPRPIGWISSVAKSGAANLAPYSFFNLMATNPSYVVFGSGGYKNSLANIEATKEFAVNIASYPQREIMNLSAASLPAGHDEFTFAGAGKVPGQMINVPRVAGCPASLECVLFKTIELPDETGHVGDWLVIGRVIGVHIEDRFIDNGRVNTAAMQLIARLGYSEYALVKDVFRMRRPD